MLTLRGTHNGEAYQIEIAKMLVSPSQYDCRVARDSGSERRFRLEVISQIGARWTVRIDGKIEDLVISRHDSQILIDWDNRNYRLSVANPKDIHVLAGDHRADQDFVRAEMTGRLVTVTKKAGDPVAAREPLATIEAMKMLNEVRSPKDGKVRMCHVEPGTVVSPGDLLFEID